MRLSFDDDSLGEIEDARHYYAQTILDLALRFIDEVERGLDKIKQSPQTWPRYSRNTRRYLLRKFPYHIVYRISGEQIAVVAVAHAKRAPNYWHDRLDG